MSGKFIVIEGLEGAGKSTAQGWVAALAAELGAPECVRVREPGGTPLAEKLRELVKQGMEGETLTHQAEILLLYAARAQLVEHVIKPALQRGAWVIADRHDLSSQAYQGGGRAVDPHLLNTLRDAVLGDFRPDLTLLLDITPSVGLQRAARRGALDRIESEQLAFFERTRARYLELAHADQRIHVIDAEQPLEAVEAAIRQTVLTWWQTQCK